MKRERFREWKVLKSTEDQMATPTDGKTSPAIRACGSSIAHGKCVYAGEISLGVPTCGARARIWNGCPFQSTHAYSPAQRNELDGAAA